MASVHEVDALVRERPGISRVELRRVLGPDVDRPLKRLELIGYIERVGSEDGDFMFFPVERPRDTAIPI